MNWPPLPRLVHCAGGPVKVRRKKVLRASDGEDAWGLWEQDKRTIWVAKGLPLEQQWRVYFHELMHAVLTDSGLENLFPEQGVEVLCDAVATARMAELRGSLV